MARKAVMKAEDVLAKLRELKPFLTTRYKVREISLFGSFVRGEQDSSSDIDLLAEFDGETDLFDWIGLALYLEEIFQRPVDIVPKHVLREELRESVLTDVVAI
jgi:predicted nucleotidyltransferase